MTGKIYLLDNCGRLLPFEEHGYDTEALLQELLESHPALLAGEQMTDSSPRRWLLLEREAPLAADGGVSWYCDHLFVDQDGIPTLVEVKRSTDARIRREVVGQMLDYAANAALRWSAEELRGRLQTLPDWHERLNELLEQGDEEVFWSNVERNLAVGRIRMVFVADVIPAELRRVVDFLASQLHDAEVFAVEVRNYQGAGMRALVPRLVSSPKSCRLGEESRHWDERSFFTELAAGSPPKAVVARKIVEWARVKMGDFWYGKGATLGSCFPRLLLPGSRFLLFGMWTTGVVEMQFQHMKIAPFDGPETRRRIIQRLNTISGIAIPEDAESRRPSFDLSALEAESCLASFLETMEWVLQEVRSVGGPGTVEVPNTTNPAHSILVSSTAAS